MGIEIERKFLIKDDSWLKGAGSGVKYYQGYLSASGVSGTRVRIAGDKGILTIKSAIKGISRSEFEYEIPLEDAKFMLHSFASKPLISKTRYKIEYCGLIWEVDVFDGEKGALLEFNEKRLDYLFLYRSVAAQRNILHQLLPPNINLSSPEYDQFYSQVSISIAEE